MFLKRAFSISSNKGDGAGRHSGGKEKDRERPSGGKLQASGTSTRSSHPLGIKTIEEGSNSPVKECEDVSAAAQKRSPAAAGGREPFVLQKPSLQQGSAAQERLVSQMQEQLAALVAKVGRMEKGLPATGSKGSPLSSQPSGSSILQGGESATVGPVIEQLQQQVAALQKQQEELRAVCAQSPTQEQVKALEQQVKELRQERGLPQVEPPAAKAGDEDPRSASSKQLTDLVQRLNASEESLAQMQALYSSKSPEGYVPRGEMMRAFNALNDTLTTKIKNVIEADGSKARGEQSAPAGQEETARMLNLVQQQGKREVEMLRKELEALRASTTQALAEAATQRTRAGAGEIEVATGAEAGRDGGAGAKVPRRASTAPSGVASLAEVQACREATAAVETELDLMRKLIDGMNDNLVRRMDALDDQVLELSDQAGALPGQPAPAEPPQSAAICPWQQKKMADSILENLMHEVGPGLESSLHDSEQALEVATGAKAEVEALKALVNKMSKKVDELSNGLVMVTGKLNDRLTKVESFEMERCSPSGYNSKVGSEAGDSVRSASASSRILLEKWKRTQSMSAAGHGSSSSTLSVGRSGSGNLPGGLDRAPSARKSASNFRTKSLQGDTLDTVLSGIPSEYNNEADGPTANGDGRYPGHMQMQMVRRTHEKRLEAQRDADAERVMMQREWSASRRGSQAGGAFDSYSVVSEADSEGRMPSVFRPGDSVYDEDSAPPSQKRLDGSSVPRKSFNGERGPRSRDGVGRSRFSEDGQGGRKNPTAGDPSDEKEEDDIFPVPTAGSVFGRNATSGASASPVPSKPSPALAAKARSKQVAMHKEGPTTAKFRTAAQAEHEKKDHLRKL